LLATSTAGARIRRRMLLAPLSRPFDVPKTND
jgi:hypothetical protein